MDTQHKTERRNSINRLRAILSGTILFSLVVTPVVEIEAAPRQIIILRHGEKQDSYKLTPIGQMRSLAVRANYVARTRRAVFFPMALGQTASSPSPCTHWNWLAQRRKAGVSHCSSIL